eukprot:1702120-Amphidinium_carterae.2
MHSWAQSGAESGFVAQSAKHAPSMRTSLRASCKGQTETETVMDGKENDRMDGESQWKAEVQRLRDASLSACVRASIDDEDALESCRLLTYELARVEAMRNLRHGSDALKES